MSVAIQFTQNFLGVQPKCGQVGKFVKDFRSNLLGVRTARIEVPCKLVEVSAHLAALGKQSGNSGQGFFSAAGNDDCFLDLDVVDGTAVSTFSKTVMDLNRRIFWNVRAMPRFVMTSGV